MSEGSARLRGRVIALPENRELDRLAAMLEVEGARTLRCPLVAILDAEDPAPIEAWIRTLVSGRFDDLIFLTGEGIQRLVALATRAGLREELLRAMSTVRKITRGPKPARALHELGLTTDLPSGTPSAQGIIDSLRGHVLARHQIGLQLYGDDPSRELVAFLETKGAIVHPVAPYRYAPASEDGQVATLIQQISRGEVDAIAFTTALQIDRLFQVAQRREAEAAMREALARMHVAAVGPIVADRLRHFTVRVDSAPTQQFFMRRLTQGIVEALGTKPE